MESFEGKVAVLTGGGTGMGRELVRKLAAAGCHVAACDVLDDNLAETLEITRRESPDVTVTGHHCDVGVESEIEQFALEVARDHATDHINLLFNNAGIGGGGSFVQLPRAQWDRTFNICWGGVYWTTRAFLPMLMASDEGHVVNTSSVNGFWASLGGGISHTAYSAAKFAVKGFSESLITDFRLNAPHLGVSVVMPGHIGTSIAINSQRIMSGDSSMGVSDDLVAFFRKRWEDAGMPIQNESDDQIRERILAQGDAFRNNAPTTAEQAAEIILDGVRENRWRILVGDDAHRIDEVVRKNPESVYDADFTFADAVGRSD